MANPYFQRILEASDLIMSDIDRRKQEAKQESSQKEQRTFQMLGAMGRHPGATPETKQKALQRQADFAGVDFGFTPEMTSQPQKQMIAIPKEVADIFPGMLQEGMEVPQENYIKLIEGLKEQGFEEKKFESKSAQEQREIDIDKTYKEGMVSAAKERARKSGTGSGGTTPKERVNKTYLNFLKEATSLTKSGFKGGKTQTLKDGKKYSWTETEAISKADFQKAVKYIKELKTKFDNGDITEAEFNDQAASATDYIFQQQGKKDSAIKDMNENTEIMKQILDAFNQE